MPLVKRLFKIMALPGLIIAVSGLLSFYWPTIAALLFKKYAFSDVFGFLTVMPYFILGVAAFAGARYNNTGIFFGAAYLMSVYLMIRTGFSSSGIISQMPKALIILSPLCFIYFSSQSKNSFLSWRTLNNAIVLLVFCLFTYSIVSDSLSYYLEPNIPFKYRYLFLSFIGGLKNYLVLDVSESHHTLMAIRGILTLASIVWFLYKLMSRGDADAAGYLGVIVSTAIIYFIEKPESRMIFFSSAGLCFMASVLESSFIKAYVDELTGIGGRRSLEYSMSNLGKKYSIAMVDIDHFKKFNDTYGHEAGDQVLKLMASRLDSAFGRNAYRYGGEEFTIIFPGKTAKESFYLLDEFREKLAGNKFIIRDSSRKKSSANRRGQEKNAGRKSVVITASIGVADSVVFPGQTPKIIMKKADQALYKSKESGRNCVSIA